ncbi:hypothetical protein AWC02_00130 [Mycolicibacter engbaekii]|uniref:Uncharacterized protein n=1 Tax=Mycolicibacter engbaekii TaxID=188915 RepID=A0A1X1U3W7_9MYCO|nr:Rv1535 family protein [Mycolicibacter engbaekii]ORV51530.1 hypothetical protein AWC02_00130 [Mycolicibacter engbaekii]
MVAIAYTDITAPASPAVSTVKKLDRRPAAPASDPVVDVTTRLLSGPLHQMYAFLWRVGVLTVND